MTQYSPDTRYEGDVATVDQELVADLRELFVALLKALRARQTYVPGNPLVDKFYDELCERFGVKPLVFDGYHDALFHEFDEKDQRHMEYVNDRGLFFDAPMKEFLKAFKETYPKLEEFNRVRIAGGSTGYDPKFSNGAAS